MALKYYNAAQVTKTNNPKESYENDYAAISEVDFENSPNVVYDEIEYEQNYGERDFAPIHRVRVDTVLAYNTGIIIGDDYKTLVFPPEFPIRPYYGMKFRWKNDYWLVINTNVNNVLVNSAEIRRCNNVLRFFGKQGERIYEPCILDYTLRFTNNKDTMMITVGNSEQKAWCQRNKYTTLIRPNDRFLFGTPEQRVSFRVYGGGIKNYLNGSSLDDNSPTLSELYLDHYEVNPTLDDFEGGFANAYLNETTIKILEENPTKLSVGESLVLNASVYRGNVEAPDIVLDWSTNDDTIIQLNKSTVTALQAGTATITIGIPNSDISAELIVEVVDEPIQEKIEWIINPNVDFVLKNQTQSFEVFVYKNGIKQEQPITFVDITTDVPKRCYKVSLQDEHRFIVENKEMFLNGQVVIHCVCGDETHDIQIELRGLY